MTGADTACSRLIGVSRAAVLAFLALAGAPALAGEYSYGGGYSVTRESNPTRSPSAATADTYHVLFGGLAYEEHTVDVDAQFLAQAEQRVYQLNDNLNDTYLYFNGFGVWRISPQLFSWTLEDSHREARVDITQVDSPANRAQVNSLSTGPDLTLHFGSTDSSILGGRLGKLDNDASGTTTNYLSAYARLFHQLSGQSTLSLHYESMHAEFEGVAAIYPTTDRTDLFVRFETRPLPNSFTLDIGSTNVDREGAESLNGRLTQVTAARQFTPESSLRLTYLSQFSDTYTDMIRSITTPTVPGDSVRIPGVDILTPDVYYNRRGDLVYASDNGSVVYALRAIARTVDYQSLNLDFKEAGGRVDGLWRYSGLTHLYFMGRYARRDFRNFYQQDTDWETILGLRFNVNQNFSLSLEGGRQVHESTAPPGDILNTRVMLLLGYSTGPLYTARSRR